MWLWKRAEPPPAPLPQKTPEPSYAAVMEQIEIFRRSLKRFETELDLTTQEHTAIRARVTKMLNRMEKLTQEPPEAPPGQQGDPRQLSLTPGPREDVYTQAARLRAKPAVKAGGNG